MEEEEDKGSGLVERAAAGAFQNGCAVASFRSVAGSVRGLLAAAHSDFRAPAPAAEHAWHGRMSGDRQEDHPASDWHNYPAMIHLVCPQIALMHPSYS